MCRSGAHPLALHTSVCLCLARRRQRPCHPPSCHRSSVCLFYRYLPPCSYPSHHARHCILAANCLCWPSVGDRDPQPLDPFCCCPLPPSPCQEISSPFETP